MEQQCFVSIINSGKLFLFTFFFFLHLLKWLRFPLIYVSVVRLSLFFVLSFSKSKEKELFEHYTKKPMQPGLEDSRSQILEDSVRILERREIL